MSLARRSVIEEYEGLCYEAGAHAGLIDLATFNVINSVLAGPSVPAADWLIVNVAVDSASIAVMRGTDLIFFRNRSWDAEGTLADLAHQSRMYYEDRLQGTGFVRAIVSGGAPAVEEVRRTLQDRLSIPIESVDPRQAAALTDRITASPALLDALAPLVGILLRDRQAVPA